MRLSPFKRTFLFGVLLSSGFSYFPLSAKELQLNDSVTLDTGFRWRWQSVDDDWAGDAHAHTLKGRISLNAELNADWRLYAEGDGVLAFNDGNYNSGVFNPGTSLIPDPQGAELNQLFFQYNGIADWKFTLGRQAISYDDERHISPVEFWQNDQTFDAFAIGYNNLQNLKFRYAFLDSAQRIFGNSAGPRLDEDDIRFAQNPLRPPAQLGEHGHSSHLININYRHNRSLAIGSYAYLIDNKDMPIASSKTYGLSLEGAFKPGKFKYEYELEWATQEGAYDNPWVYRSNFSKISGAVQYRSHSVGVTWEKYGADIQAGFQTPLGNNHKFLGWADIFNGYRLSPGLQDTYLTYKGRKGKLRWQAVFHRFENADGNIDIGNELDLELAYRYTRQWEFKMISANYRAKSGLADLPESQFDLTSLYLSVNYNI